MITEYQKDLEARKSLGVGPSRDERDQMRHMRVTERNARSPRKLAFQYHQTAELAQSEEVMREVREKTHTRYIESLPSALSIDAVYEARIARRIARRET